jgi:hypothetical protein
MAGHHFYPTLPFSATNTRPRRHLRVADKSQNVETQKYGFPLYTRNSI